jgi:ribonucleoside-diphosphate reductase alpha chain
MDYIFRRLALDYLSFDERSMLGIYSAEERQRQLETGSYELVEEEISEAESLRDHPVVESGGEEVDRTAAYDGVETKDTHGAEQREVPTKAAAAGAHTSAELLEAITGTAVDSPLCFTCGTKMRPAGSCYVCEGCGSTSGCS